MILLLFQTLEVSGYVAALIAVFGAAIGFIVAYVYLKTGIESKKADGYKSLFELEETTAKKYQLLYTNEKAEHNQLKTDYESITNEYGQLSELFAKKSLILEAFTGQYGGASQAVEHLAREGKITLPKQLIQDNIHNTSGGG